MYKSLINHINSLLIEKLTEEEINLIKGAFELKRLKKHAFLLQEGEICKTAGFITKGALKQYTVNENGKEDILGLYLENWWVGDRESYFNNSPSPYFIDAFEDTEILIINQKDFKETLNIQPFMIEYIKALTENQALNLLKRVHITKSFTAEQRLDNLQKNYPEFLKRFPQHIIASYLGMTKETLSRIRTNAIKNNG